MVSLATLFLYWLVPPVVVLIGGAAITLLGGEHA